MGGINSMRSIRDEISIAASVLPQNYGDSAFN
jgi:hypothetical protein